MSNAARFAPWFAVVPALVWLLVAAVPPRDTDGQMQLNEFGRLPVRDHGRLKPYDTLARINLMIISGAQTYRDEKGDRQPAIRWMLDVMTSGMKENAGNVSRQRK